MDNTRYAARREHLRALMRREGLDALIVSHPANRFYLSGFELHDSQCNESSGCLIGCGRNPHSAQGKGFLPHRL